MIITTMIIMCGNKTITYMRGAPRVMTRMVQHGVRRVKSIRRKVLPQLLQLAESVSVAVVTKHKQPRPRCACAAPVAPAKPTHLRGSAFENKSSLVNSQPDYILKRQQAPCLTLFLTQQKADFKRLRGFSLSLTPGSVACVVLSGGWI